MTAPAWRIASARRTGEAHARRGERGQDAFRAVTAGRALVAAVCDGAGSAPRGGAGAALAARAAVAAAAAALAGGGAVAAVDDAAALGWGRAAAARLHAAGAPVRDLATTLLLVACDGDAALAVHAGDGAAVIRGEDGWRALSWPEGGAHAAETRFLTEDPPPLRLSRRDGPVTAVALLTDGLERLVLDFAAQAPHGPFFDRMTRPLTAPGRDRALSRALGDWLGGQAVAARTDDDRTLVLAARP